MTRPGTLPPTPGAGVPAPGGPFPPAAPAGPDGKKTGFHDRHRTSRARSVRNPRHEAVAA